MDCKFYSTVFLEILEQRVFLFLFKMKEIKMLIIIIENIIARDTATETFMWKNVMESLIPVNINIHATPYFT